MRGFHLNPFLFVLSFVLSLCMSTNAPAAEPELKFAMTAIVGSDSSAVKYRQLADYLGKKTGMKTVFISGLYYSQIDNLFKAGQVDIAFLCNAHYARRKEDIGFRPVAAPVMAGSSRPKFRVYVIVNKESKLQSLEDLRGKSVDLSDPLCSTRIYAEYLLLKKNARLNSYFRKVIYSGSLEMTINLVASKLIDAGFVDGNIWDMEDSLKPAFVSKTRIIHRSPEYTIPPVVVSSSLPGPVRRRIKGILLDMHKDEEGRAILKALHITKFVEVSEKDYDDILEVYKQVKGHI